jgi:hypothetical protein
MADERDEEIQTEFQAAQTAWRNALRAHRLAPPDAGFSARLRALSTAAHVEAEICWKAHEAGYRWPRHRPAGGEPPYELRPESGRRGPELAWERFDNAVDVLNSAACQTNLHRVGSAYEEMSVAAGLLAGDIEYEDRQSGLLPPRQPPLAAQRGPRPMRKSA